MASNDQHYAMHLIILQQRCRDLLSVTSSQRLAFHAGYSLHQLLADQPLPFRASPFFSQWISAASVENAWLLTDGCGSPTLLIPADAFNPHWSECSWWSLFDVHLLDHSHQVEDWLTDVETAIYIGPHPDVAKALGFEEINPEAVLHYFYQQRAIKTGYEQYCLQQAGQLAGKAMLQVRERFYQGASALDIYLGYLKSIGQSELLEPARLAFNQQVTHGGRIFAHDGCLAEQTRRSFALTASCSWHDYQVRIGRCYAYRRDHYSELLVDFEAMFESVIGQVQLQQRYDELYQQFRRGLASLLVENELVLCSVRQCLKLEIVDQLLIEPVIQFVGLGLHEAALGETSMTGDVISPGHAFSVTVSFSLDPKRLSRYIDIQPDVIHWNQFSLLCEYGGMIRADTFLVTESTIHSLTQ
ncbi:hypothetical protein [Celerinatantimonas sp. YJH-8]|uniref:hypothetical protein n=1 Tax=Celerinatantimonas sp. YJH-8 TaxID=3228714 RepID=UPI0038C11F08